MVDSDHPLQTHNAKHANKIKIEQKIMQVCLRAGCNGLAVLWGKERNPGVSKRNSTVEICLVGKFVRVQYSTIMDKVLPSTCGATAAK